MRSMRRLFFVLALLSAQQAHADPTRIVAFGASNTYGKNVGRSEAYPAQLEHLLKEAGYDVVVVNEGVNGISTEDELARLDRAIPADTRIVIFQPGTNDNLGSRRRFAPPDTHANIEAIAKRLLDRKIGVLFTGSGSDSRSLQKLGIATLPGIGTLAPASYLQSDRQHFTPEGYGLVAKAMLPAVEAMLNDLPH